MASISAFLLAMVLVASLVFVPLAFADDVDAVSAVEAAEAEGEAAVVVDDATNLVNPQQLPDSSFIYDTSIADLAQADSYMNGQTVQVTGEVVGDSIRADLGGGYRWITLQATDGSYAQVTAYMTEEAAARIDTFGAYGRTGTMLQVRGTFNLACSEHEGLTDLHANHVSVVKKGETQADEFAMTDFAPGLASIALGGLLVLVFYRMRERQR